MPESTNTNSAPQALLYRDGTSQPGRALIALNPGSALVDERTSADWLRFLWDYARQLKYYDLNNKVAGDWSGLFPFSEDRLEEQIKEVARFLANPDACVGPQFDDYRRPHFALLLGFLEVLRPVRDRVNQFTGRHLEFYFRNVLGFAPKPGSSGSVHLLIEPAADQTPFLLAAGMQLRAGQDESGQEVHYQTDQTLIVNQARVARCLSLYLERKVTGLNDIRLDSDRFLAIWRSKRKVEAIAGGKPSWWDNSLKYRTLLALLQVALGEPNPGDPLPDYAGRDSRGEIIGIPVNDALLGNLDGLLAFIRDTLYLTVSAFRDLMALRRRLDVSRSEAKGRWLEVNENLEKAGRIKRHDSTYKLQPAHVDDFETNLNEALQLDPGTAYGGLEQVDDIYGLDRRVDPEQTNNPYNDFVTDAEKGLAMSLEDFKATMTIVNRFYEDWRRAADTLRGAGRRKKAEIASVNLRRFDATRWETLLKATLGPPPAYPKVGARTLAGLDEVDEELERLEQAFHLTAEEFGRLQRAASKPASKLWEWSDAFELLTQARLRLELARRYQKLKDRRQGKTFVRDQLEAMVLGALGRPDADPTKPAQLPEGKSFFDLKPDDAGDATYIREELRLTPDEVRVVQAVGAPQSKPTDADWDRVALILDQAQRRREGWSPPALEFGSWQNIYAAFDATQVQVGGTGPEDASTGRWRTFGGVPSPEGTTVPGTLGFMLASPLLALAEGKRTITITITITLTLSCAKAGFEAIKDTLKQPQDQLPFSFRLSTAKGWLEIPVAETTVTVLDPPGLLCVLSLDSQAPPIAPPPPENVADSTHPVLQVLLRDLKDSQQPDEPPVKRYEAFRSVVIESLQLEVEVEGLTDLRLQNDDGVLDPKKPFEPFGFAPVTGSRFVFAHSEICAKQMDWLRAEIDWLGLPEDPDKYYANYSRSGKDVHGNTLNLLNFKSFLAGFCLYDRRLTTKLKDVYLFPAGTPPNVTAALELTATTGYAAGPLDGSSDEPVSWSRYWKLELGAPDFQHSVYAAEAARAASLKDANGNPIILNPPYTPRIKQIRIAYKSSVELQPAATGAGTADHFFHVEPFGYRPAPVQPAGGWHLLPQYDNEGELYLGLAEARPPQNLAILFQMADGSADPDLPPQTVRWSYLSGNEWRDLDDRHLLSDTTRGLLNTGIICFDLTAVHPSTLLPAGFYWIRASVDRYSRAIGDLIAVQSQVVSASRVPLEPGSSDAGYALARNQIAGLVVPRPEVKAVHQPYSSFGGRAPESDTHFATRVSERLRHKDRALTCWDYERLVLEAFPDIYKVKCLPVDSTDDPALVSVVQIIVVPDIRGKHPFDPFEPKVSTDVLQKITEFLAARTPTNARVRVRNPRYCRLQLRFSVRFKPGCNPAVYLPRLNDEVCRYLSPWAYDKSSEIVFSGRVSANLIIYFIDQRTYVDYVANMRLFLEVDGRSLAPAAEDELDLSRLAGGAPDLIIVSARAHDIDLIGEDHYERESFIGINYMKIELDFQVA